ncbi:MAG: hypothetical protein DRN28_07240 [Thermoplasmata archaeon]|nr:MAG: hypothetical protein DRN28_07240 [Thermoplasmata archaeon]
MWSFILGSLFLRNYLSLAQGERLNKRGKFVRREKGKGERKRKGKLLACPCVSAIYPQIEGLMSMCRAPVSTFLFGKSQDPPLKHYRMSYRSHMHKTRPEKWEKWPRGIPPLSFRLRKRRVL